MIRYDQTLRSFASHLSFNREGAPPATAEAPEKSPMIQGFLSSYSSSGGTTVILPSLLGRLDSTRHCGFEDGIPRAVLKSAISDGNPFPPKTSYAKGKKKLLKRNRANPPSTGGSIARDSVRCKTPPKKAEYNLLQHSADDIDHHIRKPLHYSTDRSYWTETCNDRKPTVKNVAYAPHILNNNVSITVSEMIDDRLKYYISSLVRKSIKTNGGAISKSVARILARENHSIPPSELDDQFIVMDSLLKNSTQLPISNSDVFGKSANENERTNIDVDTTNQVPTIDSTIQEKTIDNGDVSTEDGEQSSNTNASICLNSIKDTSTKNNDADSKENVNNFTESNASDDEVVEDRTSAGNYCANTRSKQSENETSSTEASESKQSHDSEKDETTVTDFKENIQECVSDPNIEKGSAGTESKGTSPESAPITQEVQIENAVPEEDPHINSPLDKADKKNEDKEHESSKVTNQKTDHGYDIDPPPAAGADNAGNQEANVIETKNSTDASLKKEDNFDPTRSYLYRGRHEQTVHDNNVRPKTFAVKDEVIDHVANIQTTLTAPPSFRAEIEARVKAERNFPATSVIQACVTSFEVPRGVKGSAVKRRLIGAVTESNIESKVSSWDGSISNDILDKNAMLVTEVTLPITFAAIVSVLLGKDGGSKASLEFGASGTIQGTFRGSTSQCLLSEVHISLNTSSLVNSMVEQVKVMLRKSICAKIPNSRLPSIIATRPLHALMPFEALPQDNKKRKSELIESGQMLLGEAATNSTQISVRKNFYADKSNGKITMPMADICPAQALADLSNGHSNPKNFVSSSNTISKVTPSELIAFKDPTFSHLPTMRPYHPRRDFHLSKSGMLHDSKSPNNSQDRKRSFPQISSTSNDIAIDDISGHSSHEQSQRMRNETPQDLLSARKGALRSTETGSLHDATEERINGIELDSATGAAWPWPDLPQQDSHTYSSGQQRRRYMRRKSSGTLRSMANSVEAVGFEDMDTEQLYRRRKSSGTCGSLAAAVDAFRYADNGRRSTGGPNTSMAAAAEVIRAGELDLGIHRRNSNSTDIMRFPDMDNMRRQSGGGPHSSLIAAAEAMRPLDMDSVKIGSGVPGAEAMIGSELGSHNDLRRYEALRRRSSGGPNNTLNAAAEAIRLVEMGSVKRGSGGPNASSMAAAAEAVRMVEMEVMARRRKSSGTVTMAAAAEAVRLAESEIEASYRRRSSGGANSSVAAAAEAVRMAEMSALRQGSGGPNSSMAAAAEAVRMAEMSALRQGSGGPNSSMAAAAEAVRMAEMSALRQGSGGPNSSMAAAAEAVRMAEMSALRQGSGGPNSSMAAAAEAVRMAEMSALRQGSGGPNSSMAAAAEAVRMAEMSALRQGSGGPKSSMAAAAEAVRIAEIEASYRRRSSGGGNSSVAAEAVRMAEMSALRQGSRMPNNSMASTGGAVRRAEMNAYRHGARGQKSSMAAAAEAVRLSEMEAYLPLGTTGRGPDAVRMSDMNAYRRRSSGGPSSSAMTADEAVRLVEFDAYRRRSSGGPNSSVVSAAEVVRLAGMDAYRRRSSSGGPSASNANDVLDALRRDCGTNSSMVNAAEAVRIAEDAFRRRSSGGANKSVAAAAEAVRWAELDSLRRGSGGQNSSMAADIEAYRRRNSGRGNGSVMTESDARFADADALRRSSGLGEMDTFRRRSSGGHSTQLSMVTEAVRRAEMESRLQGGGGAGTSMASAAETIRLLEMEARHTNSRRRKSSSAASLAAAAEAVRYAENLSGANDAARFGDYDDDCEDTTRFPLRSNLMSGRSCDADQNNDSFSPATHSTSRRCMPQRPASTIRRGPYHHDHNKRLRVSFTTGSDFPGVTSENSK